ncbi:hypothetical protein GOODEAATRI_021289, partial [Goodea atripinnis]
AGPPSTETQSSWIGQYFSTGSHMAKRPGLDRAHLFTGVMRGSLGTVVMPGTLPGSPGQLPTLVTLNIGTAQRAETRMSGEILGILLTGDLVDPQLQNGSSIMTLFKHVIFHCRRDEYDRYYRSGSAAEDYYRRKDEPYRDPYLDPWNGRREPGG